MKNLIATTALISAALISPTGEAEAAIKKSVSFESAGQTLAGDLYLPENFKEGDQLKAVIVSGSWTSVKEQMAGDYAERLANKGYAALAFDFRGWGQSAKGTPESLMFVESPEEKTKDILAAAEFMAALPYVKADSMATLGICASAGYAIDAAHQSPIITSTATVAPWLHDRAIVDEVYGDNVPSLLEASKSATILDAAGEPWSGAVMEGAAYYIDPNRGAIPAYDNKFSTLSWGPWLNYDAIKTAAEITDPVLLVHSEAAAIPQGAKKFADVGGANVELVMLDDVTQFDFYDAPDAMDSAVAKVDAHFQATLK